MVKKNIFDDGNIRQYQKTLGNMMEKAKISQMELMDMIPEYHPEIDPTFFTFHTRLPIPSSVVEDVNVDENGPIFTYKISSAGTFSDKDAFKDFIENAKIDEFCFWGAVHELKVAQSPYDPSIYQTRFETMSEMFDHIKNQRIRDYEYRKYWITKNVDNILKSIDQYNNKFDIYVGLSDEIKTIAKEAKVKGKVHTNETYHFNSLGLDITLEEAKSRKYKLENEINEDKKNILYPSFSDRSQIEKGVKDKKNKIKIVSYFENEGEYYFYFYK